MSDHTLGNIFGFFIGTGLFLQGWKWLKQKRMIEDIPTSKIRSLAIGLVEVYGETEGLDEHRTLKSPITGQDCIYYEYVVQQCDGQPEKGVIRDGKERTRFMIKDSTGSVLVDPKDAVVDIPITYEYITRRGEEIPENIRQFLEEHVDTACSASTCKRVRYREHIIKLKDIVYVMGTALENPDIQQTTAQCNTENLIIQKGSSRYFYISNTSEYKVLKELKRKVGVGVAGEAAFALLSLWEILHDFNML
jgi:hypothetical protein